MTDVSLNRACLGDAELAAKLEAMPRPELEQVVGSLVAINRATGGDLGKYAHKICERTQTALLASLTPLDDAALQLVEDSVGTADEVKE